MSDNSINKSETRKVKCPHCGRLTFYSTENAFRPFCSERCRLIDLGQWASESYRVPAEENTYSEMDYDTEEESK